MLTIPGGANALEITFSDFVDLSGRYTISDGVNLFQSGNYGSSAMQISITLISFSGLLTGGNLTPDRQYTVTIPQAFASTDWGTNENREIKFYFHTYINGLPGPTPPPPDPSLTDGQAPDFESIEYYNRHYNFWLPVLTQLKEGKNVSISTYGQSIDHIQHFVFDGLVNTNRVLTVTHDGSTYVIRGRPESADHLWMGKIALGHNHSFAILGGYKV